MNRRLLTGWVILWALAVLTPGAGWGAQARQQSAARHALMLDGSVCGPLKSAAGGTVMAEVINEAVGPDHIVRKHLSAPKYEDITIQVGLDACKGLYDWITATLKSQLNRKNGAILLLDYSSKEQQRIEFFDALISEIAFPAADASSKEPAYLTLKLSPGRTQRKAGSGGTVSVAATTGKQQKAWLPANFRFQIGGLEQATTRVSKIDAFTVKIAVASGATGQARDYAREPGRIEVPNLAFTLSEAHANLIYRWHEDFVVRGNNSPAQERTGWLVWLSPDRRTELGWVKLNNMGIFRLGAEGAGSEAVARLKAHVYVETVEFARK